jgi:hypothetical protein
MQATFPSAPAYPVRVEGHLERPSRWLWLLKWLLVLPHYLVLAFLWLAFLVLTPIAFVAVLFTGRYPPGIFAFNLGVLRWSWRVAFYAFAANGTDRYPPFTLADVPDYPARLEIAYPEQHRKGLRLIGWWLAGIPHYLIAALFVGAGSYGWTTTHGWIAGPLAWCGLIGLLVFVAVLVLLVRGVYPRAIFELVLGLNRWVLRVVAYAAVMTPEYPPFRLDPGDNEPGGVAIAPPAPAMTGTETQAPAAHWSTGRVLALVFATLLSLAALAAIVAGGTAIVFDQTQRDSSGYLMTSSTAYSTNTYGLVSDSYRTGAAGDWFVARDFLGTVRIRTQSSTPVFIGIAPAKAVDSYLGNVRREVGTRLDARGSDFQLHTGGAPAAAPAAKQFWVAKASGSGTQTLTWTPRKGTWRIVLMRANAAPGVNAEVSIGARFPRLLWIGIAVLGGGALFLLIGGFTIYAAVRQRPERT